MSKGSDKRAVRRRERVPRRCNWVFPPWLRDYPLKKSLRNELLRQRYLLKDARGNLVEIREEVFARTARAVAMAEANYGASTLSVDSRAEDFRKLMSAGVFLPNSPTLMNAGRKNGMLSACFVLPVEDSIDGIFRSIWDTALIQKAGGGTGFDFGSLRPTGDLVASSGGTTSGPMSFMRVFAEATSAIQQGAFRRGANMAMMSVEHPDILKFVTAKSQPGSFENFNLSVKVTNAFMDKVRCQPECDHLVVNPRDGRKYMIPKDLSVRDYGIEDLLPAGLPKRPCYTVADVWDLIVRGAHARGEPGLCFIDRVNLDNPTPALGKLQATNPCGEQPLLPFESCNLGSINLARFILPDKGEVDWNRLRAAVGLAIRFLDDAVDASYYPIPHVQEVTLGNRKIGLGVMGFADALVLQGIRYDSPQAVKFAEKLASFLRQRAHQASEWLAARRGCFPNWAGSTWDTEHHRPMRNAACTTIAPTGSISILARCSSGIEPIFGVVTRRRALGKEFVEVHPLVERLGRHQGWLTARVRAALLDGTPASRIRGFPKRLAELLVTAHEVAPQWHVRVQAAFQQYVDSAVSKTVNLPAEATVADVDKTFRLAYELGCKGITVFRDRSCDAQTFTAAGSLRSTAPGSDKGRAPANRATLAERVGLPVSGDTACPVCERHSPNGLGMTKNTACGVAEDGPKQRTRTQPATRRRQALRRALKSTTARTGYA